MQNSLINKEPQKQTFSSFITSPAVKAKINQMISGKDSDQFITSIVSAVSANPALAECDKTSILSSALLGQSLKLSPSPQLGHYYMVPFKNKKKNTNDAQFILGWKGYVQLAIRSGLYKKLNVLAIKEGELIEYNPLTEDIKVELIQDDEIREATQTAGYYVFFEYLNGFKKSLYWTRKKMELHADKYSSAFSLKDYIKLQSGEIAQNELWKFSSFWYKDFDAQGCKTMIRQLISKWGIMSIEMQTAFEKDIESEKNIDNENINGDDINIMSVNAVNDPLA